MERVRHSRFLRSAFFPLLIVIGLVYLAATVLAPAHQQRSHTATSTNYTHTPIPPAVGAVQLQLLPASAPKGFPVEARGSNWKPNRSLNIRIDNTPLKTKLRSDSSGRWMLSLPALPVGHHDVTVCQLDCRYQSSETLIVRKH